MAVKHEIEFTISPEGEIGIEVKGVKGKDCVALTAEIEEALGVLKNRTHTNEYYQQEQEVEKKISLKQD